MDEGEFLRALQRHAPTEDRSAARRVALAVCGVLGRYLTEAEKHALGRHLPASVAEALDREVYDDQRTMDMLFRQVARELEVEPTRSRELVHAVGSLIATTMDDEARTLVDRLDEPLRILFAPPPPPATPEPEAHGGSSTIAAGRGGGRRPIASSKPGSEHPLADADPEHGQSESIAESAAPHSEGKLSTGVTRGTLARGRPPGSDDENR